MMITWLRRTLHTYIPAQFNNPLGLLIRLIKTRDMAAYLAMASAILGIVLTPLDILFSLLEKRLYASAPTSKQPLIIVVGAPRTGTTLMELVLINHLPVAFINNLTVLFPRSPIVANWIFGRFLNKKRSFPYSSFYGKTPNLAGPSDALYIWDRWLGKDRKKIPESLSSTQQTDLRQFFGAFEQFTGKPLVTKNNNLNVGASLVANICKNAYFICMTRNPLYLAQALLRARMDIHGDVERPYGLSDQTETTSENFIEDVCRQVLFHEYKIREQQQLIGSDRFWIVPYETMCAAPDALVERVATEILRQPINTVSLKKNLRPFQPTNRVRIDPEMFSQLKQTLIRLRKEA